MGIKHNTVCDRVQEQGVYSLYLCAAIVLRHAVLLVNQEGVEDVKMEERGPSC